MDSEKVRDGITDGQGFAMATCAALDAARCTPEILTDARCDAIAGRLNGAAHGLAEDFASGIEEYIKEGFAPEFAERVCPEAMKPQQEKSLMKPGIRPRRQNLL